MNADSVARRPLSQAPICLRATAGGAAGIATLILDGENARLFLQPHFSSKTSLKNARTGDLLFGRVVDSRGRTVDEAVAAPLGAQDSETGNEQIELSCHGGEGVVSAVEETLIAAGFSRGRPTELLERAYLHGKISLIEIEARLRLPAAMTARQAHLLLSHAELQRRWERLGFNMAMALRTRDLSWREKIFLEAGAALQQCASARRLLAQHHLVIAGPVNAGKSTLGNRLAGMERHLVSPAPGTTRDRLDSLIALRGLSILLTDTAGLRKPGDDIEREGQRRGWGAVRGANLCLLVLDGSCAPSEADVEFVTQACAAAPVLLVLNKQDVGTHDEAGGLGFLAGREPVAVSALTGAGCDALADAVERMLLGEPLPAPGAPFTQRHARLLEALKTGLEQGLPGSELLAALRKLVGTRPDADELAVVLAE